MSDRPIPRSRTRRRLVSLLAVTVVGLGLILWWSRSGTSATREGLAPDGLSWQVDHFDPGGHLVSQVVYPPGSRCYHGHDAGWPRRTARELASTLRFWGVPRALIPVDEGCCGPFSARMAQGPTPDGKSWQVVISTRGGCNSVSREFYPMDSPIRAKYLADEAEMARRCEEGIRKQREAAATSP